MKRETKNAENLMAVTHTRTHTRYLQNCWTVWRESSNLNKEKIKLFVGTRRALSFWCAKMSDVVGVGVPDDPQTKQKHTNKNNVKCCRGAISMRPAGITLIALIITIIVLLILAGVVLNMVIGENGIFNKARNAKVETEKSQYLEELRVKALEVQADKDGKATIQDFIEKLGKEDYEYLVKNSPIATIKSDSDTIIGNPEMIYLEYKGYYFKVTNKLEVYFQDETENNTEIQDSDVPFLREELEWSYKIKGVQNEVNRVTHLKDMSGNENDAVMYDTLYTENKDAILLDGESSYGEIAFNTPLDFPLTIELTIKPLSNSSNQIIYSDPSTQTTLQIYDGVFVLSIDTYTNTYDIPEDFFYESLKHIVVVWDDLDDTKMYINNEEQTKNDYSTASNNNVGSETYIGRRRGGNFFNGELYTFRIYNKSLSKNEVTATYNADLGFINNNSTQIQRNNLVLEYIIKNNNQNTKTISALLDQTGNNKAELYNIEYTEDKNGIFFDGSTNCYGQTSKQIDIEFPLTMSYVIKPTEIYNRHVVFSDANTHVMITFKSLGENVEISCSGLESNVYLIPKEELLDGNIKYITVTYGEDGVTDHQLYINGNKIEKESSTNYWWLYDTTFSLIGRRNYDGGNCFVGNIYSLQLYNSKLDENDIKTLYERDKKYYE